MTIILSALAVAFAAFFIWLTVRVVNRRERWAKWMLVGLIVGCPILYVASFGPAVWFASGNLNSRTPVLRIYDPIFMSMDFAPDSWKSAINWYANFGLGNGLHDIRADVGPWGVDWWKIRTPPPS